MPKRSESPIRKKRKRKTVQRSESPQPKKRRTVFCDICETSYARNSNLQTHNRHFHPERYNVNQGNRICALCKLCYRTTTLLLEHYKNDHNVELKFESLTFYCDDDFQAWRIKIQKETKSQYTVQSSSEEIEGHGISIIRGYYVCHRSGVNKTKENDEKTPKGRARKSKSGPVKCGFTCPATMKYRKLCCHEACEIEVEYQSVHLGHDIDVKKLRLTKEDRKSLAAALRSGMPIAKILEQNAFDLNSSDGIRQATRRDLHNISRDFKIDKFLLTPEDAESVGSLVKKMIKETDNPILIYKPIDQEVCDVPGIEKDDFLFGIMNEAQVRLLEMYGNVVIIDLSKTYQYNLHLTTMMVIDVNREVLPVSLLFSSRIAKETFVMFFRSIKHYLPNFKADVLFTEESSDLISAWEDVFSYKPHHLLCCWNVVRDWNVKVHAKVKDTSNKVEIKNSLKELLFELDSNLFERKQRQFIESYKSKEPIFTKYYTENYMNIAKKWAYCFRLNMGFNTDIPKERWHPQHKLDGVRGKVLKSVGVLISLINKNVAKRLISHLSSIEYGILTSRAGLICHRHKMSLEMGSEYSLKESEERFVVTKTVASGVFTYNVEKLNKSCQCHMRCDECDICIHSWSCTCADFSIRFILCKHIHYACQRKTVGGKSRPTRKSSTRRPLKNVFSGGHNQNEDLSDDNDHSNGFLPDLPDDIPDKVVPEVPNLGNENYLLLDIGNMNQSVLPPHKNYLQSEEILKAKVLSAITDLHTKLQSVESHSILQYVHENVVSMNTYLDHMNASCARNSCFQQNASNAMMITKALQANSNMGINVNKPMGTHHIIQANNNMGLNVNKPMGIHHINFLK